MSWTMCPATAMAVLGWGFLLQDWTRFSAAFDMAMYLLCGAGALTLVSYIPDDDLS